jgi:hypothetical protein
VDARTRYRRYRLRLEGRVVCVKVHMTRVVGNGRLLGRSSVEEGVRHHQENLERSRQRKRKTATSREMEVIVLLQAASEKPRQTSRVPQR